MQQTVEIRILDGQSFGRTLRFVKESREARYNAARRTWTIPATHRILSDGVSRGFYRFEVVSQPTVAEVVDRAIVEAV